MPEIRELIFSKERRDKQRWADDKASSGEEFLERGAARDAFTNFRQLKAACPMISSPVLDAQGNLVSDKKNKVVCWKDYYAQLLNHPPAVPSDELLQLAAAAEADPDINCAEPTEDEVAKAVGRLKGGKAPGLCGITAEMIKASGGWGVQWLTRIIQAIWTSGEIPPDWRKGIILPFYKGKGSRKECKNYRGITLLSVPGKVFALVLLNRVKEKLLSIRRHEQSGFTPGRSTVDRISTLSNIIQSRKEFNRSLWIAYVDLKSAFDSVDRQSLWLLLKSIGLPPKILNLMEALYTDTCSCVRADGVTSDWFEVNCGVRQGCSIAPDLFVEPMNWIMEHTVHKGFSGATVGEQVFTDLDYADDVALLAQMLEVLLLSLSVMNDEAKPLGLHINWSKTKIQQIGEPRCSQSHLTVVGENVEIVDSFVYLGCLMDRKGGSDLEIRRRIEIARSCMTLLDKHIWRSPIRLDTKIRLYRAYVIPVLLYGSETWTTTTELCRRLDAFDCWCLRKILRISYTKHVTNAEIRQVTQCQPVSDMVRANRLRFFGHVARAQPTEVHRRAVQAAMQKPPPSWKRPPGRPSTTWLRVIADDVKPMNFGIHTAWRKATDRIEWRRVVGTATLQSE